MKTLFDKDINKKVCERILLLSPDSKARWGWMTIDRMLKHMNLSFQANFGEIKLNRDWFLSSPLSKPVARIILLGKGKYLRYMPAHKKTLSKEKVDFYNEQKNLIEAISKYVTVGPGIISGEPHYILGKITPEQSAFISYKHVDHHLRQFGV